MEDFPEPLPVWAVGLAHGQYVLGAQLPTRDGRRMGNAHIVGITQTTWEPIQPLYEILTDAGSSARLIKAELDECFWPPVYVSDPEAVKIRFAPRPMPDPETYCCRSARNSNGWNHDGDCPNWVLVY